MENRDHYSDEFYKSQSDGSYRSAGIVVPILVDLLAPGSVLDIGCGVGPWLKVFEEQGVPVVHGIDGPWVPKESLRIRPDQFTAFDFSKAPIPFDVALPAERFDLITTFEFLEHAPPTRAAQIVAFVAARTDTIVLGAAAPGQGGENHINERWIDYWAELLAPHGFKSFDFLRPAIWGNQQIEPWYQQNTIGFFRNEVPQRVVEFAEAAALQNLKRPLRLVHPNILAEHATNRPTVLVKRLIRRLRTGREPGSDVN